MLHEFVRFGVRIKVQGLGLSVIEVLGGLAIQND